MKNYPKGIYYNEPRANAPEFIIGKLSIHKDNLIEWLEEEETNEKGYINFDILQGKPNEETGEIKPYIAVNDWVPDKKYKKSNVAHTEELPF